MPTATETDKAVNLTGSPQNPARDPSKKRAPMGKGSIGDDAFLKSVIIVVAAWLVLLFFMVSLRGHNI